MSTTFVQGLYINKKSENTPDFVKLKLSVKSKEFVAFLKEHTNESGYCNFDLLKSQDDKLYFKLNDWKKGDKQEEKVEEKPEEDINPEDVPFP